MRDREYMDIEEFLGMFNHISLEIKMKYISTQSNIQPIHLFPSLPSPISIISPIPPFPLSSSHKPQSNTPLHK
jgi:hypothetical protein